ncbi:hypothetical protein F5884DRAFT_895022 [Xylogone sp. PMI_703]|nr:hypothetical protein F5884DRAFT_895022 [Xylogone sp. PMI_703]
MLSRPAGCCRAVQHQLRSSDSVWLSEEILERYFRRFCAISRTARRHGSSVPGPMESRRRLGKRRMAHASEAVPIARQEFPTFWGTFVHVDMTQWQWQPPKSPPSESPNKTLLPKWLAEWDNTADSTHDDCEDYQGLNNPEHQGRLDPNISIDRFREAIDAVTILRLDDVCKEFNKKLKHALILGLVSSDALKVLLLKTADILCTTSTDVTSTDSRRMDLYNAIWGGIISSKVVGPADFDGDVLATLVLLLSQIPSTTDVQSMAREILTSASNDQLELMLPSISSLLKPWVSAWLKDCCPSDLAPCVGAIEATVAGSDYHIQQLERKVMDMRRWLQSQEEIAAIQRRIESYNERISSIIADIDEVELRMSSRKKSVNTLTDAFRNVPQHLLNRIIPTGSDYILHEYAPTKAQNSKAFRTIRYCWLSFLARSPYIDDELFVKEWKKMELPNVAMGTGVKSVVHIPVTVSESSDLVLDHWISQGFLSSTTPVRNTFSSLGQNRDLALLLSSVDRHRENFWARTKDLVNLLHKLERHKAIYELFKRMKGLNLKIPASLMSSMIDNISSFNPRLGLHMFKIYYQIRYDNKPLVADGCPGLIISLINDPSISPKAIWDIIGIPMSKLSGYPRKPSVLKPLPRSRVELIHKMALAFARSDCRSQRVALRNVMHCATYLRIHGADVKPDLSKAISHAGITREVIRENGIGTNRLNWALGIISRIEGKEVAETVDKVAHRWQEHLMRKRILHRRESNVLRVGPVE